MSEKEQEGYVLVTMVGKIAEVTSNLTKNGTPYTKGKIAIPFVNRSGDRKYKFYNFIVWSELAEVVAEIPEDTMVKMEGDLRISSYDSPCKECGAPRKMFWTDVVVESVDLI